jgi:hypothetical protein
MEKFSVRGIQEKLIKLSTQDVSIKKEMPLS